ncbi:MAG: L,D-transpeptidase [Myxococcales bacterium]
MSRRGLIFLIHSRNACFVGLICSSASITACTKANVPPTPDKQVTPLVAKAALAPASSESAAAAPRTSATLPNAAVPDAGTPTTVAPAPAAKGPRVYARTRYVWIRPEPDASKEWIGYLWTGGSVALKSAKPVYGPGCMEWYAIEPRGYVCVDGNRATLDENDAVYRAVLPYAPNLTSPWPHQYGESTGFKSEMVLPGSPLDFPALPLAIHEPRNELHRRSTVAYSREVSVNGHDFLLSADYQWVPKASVTPYPVVKFQGVKLGSDAALPLAFFKAKDRPAYMRSASGEFSIASETFARLSFVELGPEREQVGKDRFRRTKRGELWLKESDAVLPEPQPLTPWGATVGAEDTTGNAPKGRGTWLEVAVNAGYLIAYEGTKPVFTTLISPGRGGFAKPGEDPIEHALTPTGTFPVSGKFATATMEAPGEFIHSDVPWTQNFSGPHALHTAYWHDSWGEFKSGGCVNLSPIDGRAMFEFTEPALPPGWHGVRWLPWLGPSTLVVIHR